MTISNKKRKEEAEWRHQLLLCVSLTLLRILNCHSILDSSFYLILI